MAQYSSISGLCDDTYPAERLSRRYLNVPSQREEHHCVSAKISITSVLAYLLQQEAVEFERESTAIDWPGEFMLHLEVQIAYIQNRLLLRLWLYESGGVFRFVVTIANILGHAISLLQQEVAEHWRGFIDQVSSGRALKVQSDYIRDRLLLSFWLEMYQSRLSLCCRNCSFILRWT